MWPTFIAWVEDHVDQVHEDDLTKLAQTVVESLERHEDVSVTADKLDHPVTLVQNPDIIKLLDDYAATQYPITQFCHIRPHLLHILGGNLSYGCQAAGKNSPRCL